MSSPPATAAAVRTLDVSSALDRMIFETSEWWREPEADQAAFRLAAIRAAVAHHLAACPPYARYAARRGFDPGQLDGPGSLPLVPQIPTTAFKRTEVRSVPPQAIIQAFTSSGTSGVQSRVPRDELTLQRFAGSMRPDLGIWSDVATERDLDDGGEVVNLGPTRAEAGGLWFAYVMSLLELFAQTTNCVAGGRLDLDLAARRSRRCIADGRFACVAGPPALVLALCQHLGPGTLAGRDRVLVVTGGGWKRTAAERISRDSLVAQVTAALGLAGPGQVRDVFNQVELNTVFIECGRGRLHVPPWVEVIVRDPASLAPLPSGETGLLSYLDGSASSYPCFILAEDLGRTWPDPCPCGRGGQAVAITRRIEGAAHQGCSLRLTRALAGARPDTEEPQ